MSNNAFITFVLDRTGSMSSMWDEALAGLNSFIKEQAEQDGDAWLTLISFDSEEKKVEYEAWNCNDIPEITEDDIYPRAMTPLLDATGLAITKAQEWIDSNDWFDGKKIIVVLTDGLENASQEYTKEKIRDLIKHKQDDGWEFLFLASNQDAWAEGSQMGYQKGQTMSYAPTGQSIQGTYAAASSAVTRTRQEDVDLTVPEEEDELKK